MAVAATGTLTTTTRPRRARRAIRLGSMWSAAEGQQVPVAVQVNAFEVDVGDGLVGGAAGSPLVDQLVGHAVQKIERAWLASAALRAEQPTRGPGAQHAIGRPGPPRPVGGTERAVGRRVGEVEVGAGPEDAGRLDAGQGSDPGFADAFDAVGPPDIELLHAQRLIRHGADDVDAVGAVVDEVEVPVAIDGPKV